MDFESAQGKITELIRNDVLSARDEKIFLSLVLENEMAAKDVYHATSGKSGFPSRYKIVTALTSVCKGNEIAREEARSLVQRLTFRDCSYDVECGFKSWLLGESDDMPLSLPMEKNVAGFFVRAQYRTICYISKVSEFPARLCVYGMMKGYIELFKNTLQHIVTEFGIDYARNFINQLVERYNVPDANLMAMVSVIYAGPAKQKAETQLYREYIEGWVNENKDNFLAEISSVLGGDWHKKVLKKLEKDGI